MPKLTVNAGRERTFHLLREATPDTGGANRPLHDHDTLGLIGDLQAATSEGRSA
jgi:hypothetical protein